MHPFADVALLRLSSSVAPSHMAFPICMPKQHSALLKGELTTVSGYGDLQSGKKPIITDRETVLMINQKQFSRFLLDTLLNILNVE